MSAANRVVAFVALAGLATAANAQFGMPADLDFHWTATIINPGSMNPLVEWDDTGVTAVPGMANTWQFPNLHIPANIKNVYIYADWGTIQNVPGNLPGLFTVTGPDTTPPTEVMFQSLTGNAGLLNNSTAFLWHYTINPQPDWERITFNNLQAMPATFEVGTKCVPEPAVVGLLVSAGLVATRRRR